MNVQQTQKNAFRLFNIVRAWNLHMTANYDAWETNFTVNEKFQTFLRNSVRLGTDENNAIKATLFLTKGGIGPDEYRDFVVTTNDIPTRNITLFLRDKVEAYTKWKNRSWPLNAETDEGDFLIEDGIPRIMGQVRNGHIPALLAAEALHNGKSWNHLYAMKEHSTFVFDLIWPQIHKYKPLFKG